MSPPNLRGPHDVAGIEGNSEGEGAATSPSAAESVVRRTAGSWSEAAATGTNTGRLGTFRLRAQDMRRDLSASNRGRLVTGTVLPN